ncbi:MAG: phospho-sugar mutase [Myxococcales bacterium]|nr:phospho-sugar mutase [Myxococcales bacterium]
MTALSDLIAQAHNFAAQDPERDSANELLAVIERAQAGDGAAADDLAERFADRLRFGTAGLRGRIEGGTNRMNRVVVMQAAWGLGQYIKAGGMGVDAAQGVVIAFDGRRLSRQFAEDTAAVLAAMGVPSHLFPEVAPTPVCAYAVRHLGAAAGVMVTASHNPPDDNGYKVYQATGGQIIAPHDTGISEWIEKAPAIGELPRVLPFDAAQAGLRHIVGDEVVAAYFDGVAAGCVHPGATAAHPMSLVYTAMHGVGHGPVERALRQAGVHGLAVVPSQTEPDGAFPTVAFPNPEEPGAMDRALELAAEVRAELILANDPDADRLAVGVPDGDGYRMLSGNDVGALLGHDAIAFADTQGKTKLAVTTIVSSSMLGRIAGDLGAAYAETLTGFKWLAHAGITRLAERDEHFVFGFEEALGYSVGPLVKDKDGVSAVVRLVELACWLKGQGRTLTDELDRLALTHGLSVGAQWSVRMPGQQGRAQIDKAMAALRQEAPAQLAGLDVVEWVDLADGSGWAASDAPRDLDLPSADVLTYYDAEGTRLVVRPSGTEPKIKFYLESVGWPKERSDIDGVRAEREQRLSAIRADIMGVLGL